MEVEYDVVVIGAGPGGYVAAIRAAQLGLKTAVVERDELGGVCLNWGCIPSKALLKNAEILSLLRRAEEFGFYFDNLRVDYAKAVDRSRSVVERNTRGVAYLLRKNKIDHIVGEASLSKAEGLRDSHTIEVAPEGRVIRTKNVILSTGARPRSIPALPVDGELVMTSRHALELRQLPSSVVIVGAGATGVEFAYLYNAYGVNCDCRRASASCGPKRGRGDQPATGERSIQGRYHVYDWLQRYGNDSRYPGPGGPGWI